MIITELHFVYLTRYDFFSCVPVEMRNLQDIANGIWKPFAESAICVQRDAFNLFSKDSKCSAATSFLFHINFTFSFHREINLDGFV